MDKETLEKYRRMTPGERLAITFQMIREEIPRLLSGTPEEIDRRFELMRQENDERNCRMLTAIARTRKLEERSADDADGPPSETPPSAA